MTTYRARCGALIVRDVTPGEFRSVRERLADYIEAQNPGPINGNVNAASAFRLAANRVRLWQVTARPFWDPVTGAAIAHLGLPILPDGAT